MESERGIGQHFPAREFQLHHSQYPDGYEPVRPGHSAHIRFRGKSPGPRAIRVRAGFDPPWQLDHQRRTPLGSLSTLVEPPRGGSAAFGFALFPVSESRSAFLIRPRLPNAVIRKYSAFEFHRHRVARSGKVSALASAAIRWELLRGRFDQNFLRKNPARRKLFPPSRK